MKQAFLFLSCQLSKAAAKTFDEISTATIFEGNITRLLYHKKDANHQDIVDDENVFYFSDEILVDLKYRPLGEKLIPGNNHFPLLKFFKENPDYDYYWCIEDDVRYTGDWSHLFSHFENSDKSFISSYIHRYSDDPKWPWWLTLKYSDKWIKPEYLIRSFNPIYRISRDALAFIDQELLDGWEGHHEVLFATLLHAEGFGLMDFGGVGEFVSQGSENKFYLGNFMQNNGIGGMGSTFRWRPVHEKIGAMPNKLYHPVKG